MSIATLVIGSLTLIGLIWFAQRLRVPLAEPLAPALTSLAPLAMLVLLLVNAPQPEPETRVRVVGQRVASSGVLRIGSGPFAHVFVPDVGIGVPLDIRATYDSSRNAFRVVAGPGPVPVSLGRSIINGRRVRERLDVSGPGAVRVDVSLPRRPLRCRLGWICNERIITVHVGGRASASRREIPRGGIRLSDLGVRLPADVTLLRWCPGRRVLGCPDVWVAGGTPGTIWADGHLVGNTAWLDAARLDDQGDTLRIGAVREARLLLTTDSVGMIARFGGTLARRSWPLLPDGAERVYRVAAGGLQLSPGTLPVLDLNVVPLGPGARPFSGALVRDTSGWSWHADGVVLPVPIMKPIVLQTREAAHIIRLERPQRPIAPVVAAGSVAWLMGAAVMARPGIATQGSSTGFRAVIAGLVYLLFALRALLSWRVANAAPGEWKGVETTLLGLCALPLVVWFLEDAARRRGSSLWSWCAVAAATMIAVSASVGSADELSRIGERLFSLGLITFVGVAGTLVLNRALAGPGWNWNESTASIETKSPLFGLVPPLRSEGGDEVFRLLRAVGLLVILSVSYAILSVAARPSQWIALLIVYALTAATAYTAASQRTGVRPLMSGAEAWFWILAGGVLGGVTGALAGDDAFWAKSPAYSAVCALLGFGIGSLLTRLVIHPRRGWIAGPELSLTRVLPPRWLAIAPVGVLVLLVFPSARRLTIILGYAIVLAGILAGSRVFALLFSRFEMRARPGGGWLPEHYGHGVMAGGALVLVFIPFFVADLGLLLLALGPALVLGLLTAGLFVRRGAFAVLTAASLLLLGSGALAVFRMPLASLGEQGGGALWRADTWQMRAAAAWAPEKLEDQLVLSDADAAAKAVRTLQQVWGMRSHAAAGGLVGAGLYGVPFTGHAIPTEVALTDNVASVFMLAEHGLLGGGAVLALYLLTALVLLRAAKHAAGHFRDIGRAALLIGLATVIAAPALYMMAANVGAVPLTGQNIPFLGLRSTADAAFGVWLFALALLALPRESAAAWGTQDTLTRERRREVQQRTIYVAVSLALLTVAATTSVARGVRAQPGPFTLERLADRLAEMAERQVLVTDTVGPDTLVIRDTTGVGERSFVHRLVRESNAPMLGRAFSTVDCLSAEPVISPSADGGVATNRAACRLSESAARRDQWRGMLTAGPSGSALLVMEGATGVTLVQGAPRLAASHCGETTLPPASSASLSCSGATVDIEPSQDGRYIARYVRGGRVTPTPLARGAVLDVWETTLVVDSLPRGALGFSRWRNGGYERTSESGVAPVLVELNALLGHSVEHERVRADEDIHLTLRPGLMRELDAALAAVCGQSASVRLCAVPVVDPATGNILALSSWERGTRSFDVIEPSFRNHRSGSTVKPLLAAAALSAYPALAGLTIDHSPRAQWVAGWPLEVPLVSTPHPPCTGARIGFDCFLAGSNNHFAASLGFLALASPGAGRLPEIDRGRDGGFSILGRPVGGRPRIKDSQSGLVKAAGSPLALAFARLFGAAPIHAEGDAPDSTLWMPLVQAGFIQTDPGWSRVSPQVPRLPFDSLAEGPNPLWALGTFMYGDRENNWSNLALTRGMIRIVRGDGIDLRLVERVGATRVQPLSAPAVDFGPQRALVLRGMRDVIRRGTASPWVSAAQYERRGFQIYGKTGTLTNQTPHSTSFLFAVLPPARAGIRCTGAAGIVYVEHDPGGVTPAAATFTRTVAPVLERHLGWAACGPVAP